MNLFVIGVGGIIRHGWILMGFWESWDVFKYAIIIHRSAFYGGEFVDYMLFVRMVSECLKVLL